MILRCELGTPLAKAVGSDESTVGNIVDEGYLCADMCADMCVDMCVDM